MLFQRNSEGLTSHHSPICLVTMAFYVSFCHWSVSSMRAEALLCFLHHCLPQCLEQCVAYNGKKDMLMKYLLIVGGRGEDG